MYDHEDKKTIDIEDYIVAAGTSDTPVADMPVAFEEAAEVKDDDGNLHRTSLLISVKFSAWKGERVDRPASDEIVRQSKAESKSARVVKSLVSKEYLTDINASMKSLKTIWHLQTLPWMDSGQRIIPATKFPKFMDAALPIINQFDQAADKFASEYPDLLSKAEARLGSLYRAEDYPDVASVRALFAVTIRPSPVPHYDDWRVDLPNEQIEAIKLLTRKSTAEACAQATRVLALRLYKLVHQFHDRIDAFDKGETERLRSQLTDAIGDLAGRADDYNFEGNHELAGIISDMKNQLAVPTKGLVRNEEARAVVKSNAENLMGRLRGLGLSKDSSDE